MPDEISSHDSSPARTSPPPPTASSRTAPVETPKIVHAWELPDADKPTGPPLLPNTKRGGSGGRHNSTRSTPTHSGRSTPTPRDRDRDRRGRSSDRGRWGADDAGMGEEGRRGVSGGAYRPREDNMDGWDTGRSRTRKGSDERTERGGRGRDGAGSGGDGRAEDASEASDTVLNPYLPIPIPRRGGRPGSGGRRDGRGGSRSNSRGDDGSGQYAGSRSSSRGDDGRGQYGGWTQPNTNTGSPSTSLPQRRNVPPHGYGTSPSRSVNAGSPGRTLNVGSWPKRDTNQPFEGGRSWGGQQAAKADATSPSDGWGGRRAQEERVEERTEPAPRPSSATQEKRSWGDDDDGDFDFGNVPVWAD
ncbi:hypothetical protein HK104_010464 [Borealophlyctis nickersoniae]|nr:hypothetical protein HK104_010464 [Borealophlyctis nickersoniae]